MKDYERDFLFRINRLGISGPEFSSLAKETLREVMGEPGSSVVLYGMSKGDLESPERFAKELSTVFGGGAIPILKAIVVGALVGLEGQADPESRNTLPDAATLLEERYGIMAEKQAYLHDHRMKDEMAEYFESLDEEQSSDGNESAS